MQNKKCWKTNGKAEGNTRIGVCVCVCECVCVCAWWIYNPCSHISGHDNLAHFNASGNKNLPYFRDDHFTTGPPRAHHGSTTGDGPIRAHHGSSMGLVNELCAPPAGPLSYRSTLPYRLKSCAHIYIYIYIYIYVSVRVESPRTRFPNLELRGHLGTNMA